jgi:hypothetical protein
VKKNVFTIIGAYITFFKTWTVLYSHILYFLSVYRLSRARRTIENAFGVFANRFRIFRSAIHAKPETVEHEIRACLVLHNMLIKEDSQFYIEKKMVDHFGPDGELIDGGWRNEGLGSCFSNLSPVGGNHSTEAKQVRDTLAHYYSNDGQVPWQRRIVNCDGRQLRQDVDNDQSSDDPDLA